MPIRVAGKLVIKIEDAEFVFDPITLGDVANFSEETAQQEMLKLLASKLRSWVNVLGENDEPLECTAENLIGKLPIGISAQIIKELTEKAGIGENFGKK